MRFYINDNNSVLNGARSNWSNIQTKYPPLDVVETVDGYKVKVELPGFKLEDINIKLEKHILRISSKVEACNEEERRYIIRERVCKEFTRTLTIGSDIDQDKIKASFTNGILTIDMPKKEEVMPKQINVAVTS